MGILAFQKRERTSLNISLVREKSPEALKFIREHIDTESSPVNMLATSTLFNVEALPVEEPLNLVNLKTVNNIQYINKFFEAVNAKLALQGMFIGCFESKEQRKRRIFNKYPLPFAYIFYYLIDFTWKRVFPKVSGLKKIYYGLSKGHNRVITASEVLGRLISCGFKICGYQEIENQTYFCAEKVRSPEFDDDPSYGPLISLSRVAQKGSIIQVYKFRTMHPYSEYLQGYIYEQNNLQDGGKFKDDFRISTYGALMRKFWLDELPMLYNWLKGDLKLVGIRPLSNHYFALYPQSFQKRRIEYKPGLVPPFYVDLPETLDEIIESEKKYLEQYDKHPLLTDCKYFFKALYNIFIKRARSK